MARPTPREVFDNPQAFWSFLTQPRDDDLEGQHFDRKEAGRPQPGAGLSTSAVNDVRDLVIKTVSAFANPNVDGGLLVLGISSTGEVVGIDHLTELQRNSIMDLNKLLLHHAAEIRTFDCTDGSGTNKTVCLIFSGFSTTGICETPGNHPKAWTRSGSQCIAVTQAVRDSLRVRKGLVSVESDPVCEFAREDVDNVVLAEFRKVFEPEMGTQFDDERLLKEAGAILKKDGTYWFTMPGLLFFASNPQRVFPHTYVRLMRFGVQCGEYRDRGLPTFNKEFKGSITSQIRAARAFFRDSGFFKRFEKRKPDGGFIEEPELPPLSVDEAIVNAVTHRDYSIKLPIECESYLDAFIVKNPGRVLQRNVDLPDSFRLDTTPLDSTPRNSKLLEWLKLMRDPDGRAFVQAVSEGTKRMTAEMIGLRLPPPRFKLMENESILTLQSNAAERERAILAATNTTTTETINFFPLFARQDADPAASHEIRTRQGEFLTSLRDSLVSRQWYVDHFSFSRLTVHRRGNELAIPEVVRPHLHLYPAYAVQLQECFGHLYLCVDYTCEVLSVRRLNHLLRSLPKASLLEKTCVAKSAGWRRGRLAEINEDWAKVHLFDDEQDHDVPCSDVIPNLSLRQIEQVLRAEGVQFDLHAAVKRASLASEPAAARTRAEKINHFVSAIAAEVFPITFGAFEIGIGTTPVALAGRGSRSGSSLEISRLNEPPVEFRDRHSSPDVRDGITKFGSFNAQPHQIELIPVCLASFKERMEKLISRLIEGKYKYRGSERTFATKFVYNAIVTVADARDLEHEIERLLRQHPEWCGARELNRLFLVHCPEQDFPTDDESAPYYVVKRRLLEAGIPCQMVDSPTLSNPDWKDLNLALNVIAKCGVTPWVLPECIPDADFFVGLSYTQSRDAKRIMGFANVFNSYGRWVFYAGNTTTFEPAERSEHLASLVNTTLEKLRHEHSVSSSPSLIFHHSVRLAREDRTAILKSVRSIVPDACVTFVWVNGHANSRLFDARPETDGSVRRGSYVSLSRRRILLSTTGYNPYRKAMGSPRPLELTALHFSARSEEPCTPGSESDETELGVDRRLLRRAHYYEVRWRHCLSDRCVSTSEGTVSAESLPRIDALVYLTLIGGSPME